MSSRPRPPASTPRPLSGAVWLLPALLAFLGAVYWQVPASFVLRFLPTPLPPPWTIAPSGLATSGTLWSGSLHGLAVAGQPIGAVNWQLSPLQGLVGRVTGEVDVGGGTRFLATRVRLSLGGDGSLSSLEARWPLADLQPVPAVGWQGQLVARLESIELRGGIPVGWSGKLRVNGLTAPGKGPALGDFEVDWPAGRDQGRVRDIAGPVELRAALLRVPTGGWRLEGEAAPRAAADQQVRQALLMFGPPDSAGRHPLRIEFGVSPPP